MIARLRNQFIEDLLADGRGQEASIA